MSDLYRSVEELPETAKSYLRAALWLGGEDCVWFDDLKDEYKEIVLHAERMSDISDEILYAAYDYISFVPEDFAPGAGDDWSKV